MKQLKLELPKPKEGVITIADLSATFGGVIIALKNNNAVGMILYDDSVECWYYTEYIYHGEYVDYSNSLMELIGLLLKENTCDSFNVIKFE